MEAIGLIVERSVIANGFENSGTIEVVAEADSSTSSARADASGINLYDVLFSGDFTNSGSVSVTAEAHGYYTGAVTAYGIRFRGGTTGSGTQVTAGSFLNSGSVVVSADVFGDTDTVTGTAKGVTIDEQLFSGSVVNSGTISVTLMAESGTDSSAYAEAMGIEIDDSEFDGFENSGSISVEAKSVATSSYGAYANEIFGIFIEDSVVSSAITNSGDVSVSAEAIGYSEAVVSYVAGIKLNYLDITAGGVENSGSITVSAKAELSSYDDASLDEIHGLLISESNVVGNISNDGTITISTEGGLVWFFCKRV